MDEVNKSIKQLSKTINKAAEQAKKILNAFYGTLEPYQLYELRHPKKKPRGSIRRKRREREKKRYMDDLYIDDIYSLMADRDNKR